MQKMFTRFGYGRPRRKRHKTWLRPSRPFVILLVLALCTYIVFAFLFSVRPIVNAVAQSALDNLATKIIYKSTAKVFGDAAIQYDDLVTISRDDSNKITGITIDAVKMNQIKSDLALDILNNVMAVEETGLAIPLGNFTQNEFFSGMGPKIPFKIVPYNSVYVDYSDKFVAMGINQTSHNVYMDIKTQISAILPGLRTNAEINTSVMVAQTVIVGEVPETYMGVNEIEGELEDYILDVMP